MSDIVSEDTGTTADASSQAAAGSGHRTLTIARSALLLAAALVVCLALMLAVGLQ